MKRTVSWLAGAALALCVLAGYNICKGQRPLAALEARAVVSASVRLSPPDVTVPLDREQIEALVPLLRQVRIFRRDDSWRDYAGQGVCYALELAGGESRTVTAFAPFLILDGVGYRTRYEPCQALNSFGNEAWRTAGEGGADGRQQDR